MNGGGSLTAPVTGIQLHYCDPNSEKCPCSDCNDMEYDSIMIVADIWIDIDPLNGPKPQAVEAKPEKLSYENLPHLQHCEAFD
jgi:hypothetical protein